MRERHICREHLPQFGQRDLFDLAKGDVLRCSCGRHWECIDARWKIYRRRWIKHQDTDWFDWIVTTIAIIAIIAAAVGAMLVRG